MGLFSFLGTAVGTALGSPALGAAIGGAVDKGLKKKGSTAATTTAAAATPDPYAQAASIKSLATSKPVALSGDIKVAQVYHADPWQPTRDWYKDLGGKDEAIDTYDFSRNL